MKRNDSNSATLSSKNSLAKCWGLFLAAAFWICILLINVFHLFPDIQFRGVRYSGGDFEQYYATGVAAAEGLWDVAYPDSAYFERGKRPATAPYRPKMQAELKRRGADTTTKNIYPPPTAILFVPLALWDFEKAEMFFLAIMGLSVVVFLVLLSRECAEVGLPNWLSGIFIAVVGTGLPLVESVLIGNVTVLIGIACLLALRGIRKGKTPQTIIGFAIAGLTKGFSVSWVPALFIWKRWRVIVWGASIAAVLVAIPVALSGGCEVYREYFTDVLPISRGNLYRIGDGNCGLPSFVAWVFKWPQLPSSVSRCFTAIHLGLVCSAYCAAWKASKCRENIVAAQSLAIFVATTVFQTFSTVCWPHYAVNVIPCLPAAASVALKRPRSFALLGLGFILAWVPIGNAAKHVTGIYFFGFGRFAGYVILLIWAMGELLRLANFFHRGNETKGGER